MSFLSSSVSFTRFNIVDEIPNEVYENLLDKLKQFAIMDIDETSEEQSFGWTSFDDMLDTKWERSYPQKADYITFAFRLDTRRIPPAVLKKHVRIAMMQEEAKIQEQGKKYVSRDRKKEISEQVKLRLRVRFLPIPAEFAVVWSMEKKQVFFASTQQKVIDMFTDYFTQTFNLALDRVLPYTLAQELLGEGCEDALDALETTEFA